MASKFVRVYIEGNIGCGKSKLLDELKQISNIIIRQEPVHEWQNFEGHNLLQRFYENSQKWGMLFQTAVMVTMLEAEVDNPECGILVAERSIHSAYELFACLLHKNGKLSEEDMAVLRRLKELFSKRCKEDEFFIYLRLPNEEAWKRSNRRNRAEEKGIPVQYFEDIGNRLDEWLLPAASNVFVVDAEQSATEVATDVMQILKQVSNGWYLFKSSYWW